MEEMCGFHHPTANDYADEKVLFSPENLTPAEYRSFYYSSSPGGGYDLVYESPPDDLISPASSITPGRPRIADHEDRDYDDDDMAATVMIKAKIASHPRYTKLLQAYIDCQKVGAPPEISCMLDEIRRENDVYKRDSVSTCLLGADPELDDFMETFCDVLVKYKSDLSRPFEEATAFFNQMELQLRNLCIDESSGSSDEDFSGIENEGQEAQLSEDRELKERLLHKYGRHIGSLKLEFSKKKKKGKLPKEARQTLLQWWNLHYKWPYPTEADKISLAESTGLDQKQINNWFINQRKRHWKPSENMHLAVMGNIAGQVFTDD